MRVLIAEDDPVTCLFLEFQLEKLGFDVVIARDGSAAWEVLCREDAPRMAVLDWMMPEKDGVELCRHIRRTPALRALYVLLLTTRDTKMDIAEGLNAGADDYLTKPPDLQELAARLRAGERIVRLQDELTQRVAELEEALKHVKRLQGILPICSYCKKIRDDKSAWRPMECYISENSDAEFSHGICPECFEDIVKPEIENAVNLSKKNRLFDPKE
ncbi:MAG: response regulator [candidate division Zixibacteria bacterium]|nr:response regulator [candidate division Zixibacteria bacterium]